MTDATIQEAIGVVLFLIIAVIVIAVPFSIYNLFYDDKTDATVNNFDAIVARMTNMDSPSAQTMEIFILDNYFIASWKDNSDANRNIKAPSDCGTQCLCLCTLRDSEGKMWCQAGKCAKFPMNVEFTQPVFLSGDAKPRPICIHKDKTKTGSIEISRFYIEPMACER
jgi:hypothetical protein